MRTHGATHKYVTRVLPWMKAGLALELFCNLLNIIETDAIPTAAVMLSPNTMPQMLMNPEFVDDNIKHDAHLALLILHELYHILFAHMMLGNSMLHNIAFDAIINAYLSRKFNSPAYRGFFEQFNSAEDLPGVFLRPPEGWPHAPVYPELATRGATQMLKRLYPPISDMGTTRLPLAREVYDLLKRTQDESGQLDTVMTMKDLFQQGDSGEPMTLQELFDKLLDEFGEDAFPELARIFMSDNPLDDISPRDNWSDPTLLGNHDGTDYQSPEAQEMLQDLMDMAQDMAKGKGGDADHPDPQGSGRGALFQWNTVQNANPKAQARRKFWNLLNYLMQQSETMGNPVRVGEMHLPAHTPGLMFNPHDRYAYTRMELTGSIISRQPTLIYTRHLPPAATLYLDVSASMKKIIAEMVSLVRPFVQRGILKIYQFSTTVNSVKDLNNIGSTGGTDINCVLQHMIDIRQSLGQVIILTDGDVGDARPELIQSVKRIHVPVYGVLTNNLRYKMQPFVTEFVNL